MLERFLEAPGMLVFLVGCWAFLRYMVFSQARKQARGLEEDEWFI